MNEVADAQQTAVAEQREDLEPMKGHLTDLIMRHNDATQKLSEFHDAKLDAERALRLANEAVSYQDRRVTGLYRRIVTIRDAIRAAEDESWGLD